MRKLKIKKNICMKNILCSNCPGFIKKKKKLKKRDNTILKITRQQLQHKKACLNCKFKLCRNRKEKIITYFCNNWSSLSKNKVLK